MHYLCSQLHSEPSQAKPCRAMTSRAEPSRAETVLAINSLPTWSGTLLFEGEVPLLQGMIWETDIYIWDLDNFQISVVLKY